MDIIGDRRAVSYYREIVFGLASGPAILAHAPLPPGKQYRTGAIWHVGAIASWSWNGHEDKSLRVEVYADADEVELILNKEPLGRVRVGEEKPYAAKIEIPFAPGILEAVAFKGGKEIGRNRLESAGNELRLNALADRPEISATPSDLAYVGVALTDARGVTHAVKDRPVTVEVTGTGVLAGFGSARGDNAESFLSATHATYHGRAMAIVRPTGAGQIMVRVSAEECDPVSISIVAA
jgi:beta-galactosidase